jgi:uncharacterized membrane protein
LTALLTRAAYAARTWLLWPALFAIATGAGLFALAHPALSELLARNKLGEADRFRMLAWVVAALAGVLAVYAAVVLHRRRRDGAWSVPATAAELEGRLFPLLGLPLLPALGLPLLESDHPNVTLLFIAVFAAVFARGVYAWSGAPPAALAPEPSAPRWSLSPRTARLVAGAAVGALWIGYGWFFARLAIINHHALHTRTTDLGYYDNIVYQSIHGRFLGCSLIKQGYHGSAHFDPLLVVLSPLYLLYPRAESLLVLQAVWVGAGVVPVYLIAFEALGRRPAAVLFAAAYALHPALHGATMYEFHSLTLLPPLALFAVYCLGIGATKRYYAALAFLLLCREDAALLAIFIGLYGVVSGRPRLVRLGATTMVVSLFYFFFVKTFFMTSPDLLNSGDDSYSFAYYYSDLIPNLTGTAGLTVSVFTNPVFVLRTLLAEPKIQYLLELFLPLALLPLFARPGRVMLLYGLAFCLLASRPAVYSTHFQYSSAILPVAFAVAPAALRGFEDGRLAPFLGLDGPRLGRALLGFALAASLLLSWKLGGLVDNAAFRGGFYPVARELTAEDEDRYAWLRRQVETIPADASVAVTDRLGCHVSNRRDVFFYSKKKDVDYVLERDDELDADDLAALQGSIHRREIVRLSRYEGMALYRRKTPKAPPVSGTSP